VCAALSLDAHLSSCSGYFAASTGLASCIQCPQGQVGYITEQDFGLRTSQNTECRLCGVGTSRDGTRSSKQTKVTTSTDGSEYVCTQASCTGCLLCAKGSYALQQGMFSCKTCGLGKMGKGTDDASTPASERATEAAACESVRVQAISIHPPTPSPAYIRRHIPLPTPIPTLTPTNFPPRPFFATPSPVHSVCRRQVHRFLHWHYHM
jgi:hypothetical protein